MTLGPFFGPVRPWQTLGCALGRHTVCPLPRTGTAARGLASPVSRVRVADYVGSGDTDVRDVVSILVHV